MQIIPAIDIKDGRCVRLLQGDFERETVFAEDPAEQAKRWEAAGAEMIHIVDLDAAKQGRPLNADKIQEICKSVSCKVQLGGGIRTLKIAKVYFDLGIERLVLGTLLLKNLSEAKVITEAYPQKIVAGIDAKDGMAAAEGWMLKSSISVSELIAKLVGWPLSAIAYTDISRDGMMQGANLTAIEQVAASSDFQVIASGGISSRNDLVVLSQMPNVTAAIIGQALYTGVIDLALSIQEFQ
ncbi:MAG: 1-(5-phosphoribosyl)-5-[(5-phosphoribosylamino)methylideneamino]imidazole-4-carboxamide isomerase [Nitrospinota bacterium]